MAVHENKDGNSKEGVLIANALGNGGISDVVRSRKDGDSLTLEFGAAVLEVTVYGSNDPVALTDTASADKQVLSAAISADGVFDIPNVTYWWIEVTAWTSGAVDGRASI